MMFVLSVGFLMAQGVFTYQTVVVDNQGKLVVNKEVTAKVTITDGTNTFVQENLTGTTSNNGLLILSVGDKTDAAFNNMKWENATIQVEYPTVEGATVETDNSRIPAVPYALQSDVALNTQMIVDYISSPNTTMDDVDTILKAMKHGTPKTLKESVLNAIVDSVKANYQLSKEVVMDYLAHATKADVAKLYDSLMSNDALVKDMTDTMVQIMKDSTEMVYDILRAYTLDLTETDVNGILNVLDPTIKHHMLDKVVGFLETDTAKTILIPVLMDYMTNVTVSEVERLNQAVHANTNGAYDSLINCFNKWMDEYFANYFTGTGNVQTLVDQVMDTTFYSCQTDVNLCQLKHDLDSINNTAACLQVLNQDGVAFFLGDGDVFVATINYQGTEDFEVYVSVLLPDTESPIEFNTPSTNYINKTYNDGNTIRIAIPMNVLSTQYVFQFDWSITICSNCNNCLQDNGIGFEGSYGAN
jgi:DNA-binding protein Fis